MTKFCEYSVEKFEQRSKFLKKSTFSRPKENGLVVLSFGAGQDSTDILYRLIKDGKFKESYLGEKSLVVVFSDTLNEHQETYVHLVFIKHLCRMNEIEFWHLKPNLGFHSDSWQGLEGQFIQNENIALQGVSSCTLNLKILPIYRWLDFYCSTLLGKPSRKHRLKPHICEFGSNFGKIQVMIGFTSEEHKRIQKSKNIKQSAWWENVEKIYPLADLGVTRADTIENMTATGLNVPPPSNCIMCPNISRQELVWLWRTNKKEFIKWARYERRKMKKWAPIRKRLKMDRKTGKPKVGKNGEWVISPNVGVFKRERNLIQELRLALEDFGDWSIERLNDYKFSHGHCISNGY